MSLLFIIVCLLVLSAAWWLLVIAAPARTGRQSVRVAGAALFLAVITVLWAVKLTEMGFHYFSK
jgi:hypothetical protein